MTHQLLQSLYFLRENELQKLGVGASSLTTVLRYEVIISRSEQRGQEKKAPARTLRFQLNEGVLRLKLRWPLVFMVFLHCLWVYNRRTDVSEQVYRLGRGPRHHYRVGF